MKATIYFISILLVVSCHQKERHTRVELDNIAAGYIKLGLNIGKYDPDFVDAYYGPDSLKADTVKETVFPKAALLSEVSNLLKRLSVFSSAEASDTLSMRARWMTSQLIAFGRRIKIFSGEREPFDKESKELFGVVAPSHPEEYYRQLALQLNLLLPGDESIPIKFQKLAGHFIIPKDKIDTVFKTAIGESRKRTLAHYNLPSTEHFTLEYVTGKSWSGYNWYKGNYTSDIQINTDLDIFIERAIDVASHESYPGHHVYNMLLEKNLYHDKGWLELSLYPLFSPQSLIAEGSANYGIEVAFPGIEKTEFAKNVLLPIAGLDSTGIDLYFKVLEVKGALNFARNEVARGLINNSMNETEALRWLMDYGLNNMETALKSISFIKKYGSYVINYNYGQELVKNYIESNGGTETAPAKRWELFGKLLSNEITPDELIIKK
ncbi:MAG: hypothetical protein ABIT58_01610 [Ferruginibacter sp.]